METIFDYLELLIFAVIILAQVVASIFAKKKKEERRRQQQQQKPTAPATVKVSTKAAAAPPKAKIITPKATRRGGNLEDDWVKAIEERERKATKTKRNEESEAAYGQTAAVENLLAAQARVGVVWSEILQPPVSMRA